MSNTTEVMNESADFWFYDIGVNVFRPTQKIRILLKVGLNGKINQYLIKYMNHVKRMAIIIME